MPAGSAVRLRLAANAAQVTLLVAVNAIIGGVLGAARIVLPLLAEHEFHVIADAAVLTCAVASGAAAAGLPLTQIGGVEVTVCRNVTDVDDVLTRAADSRGRAYDEFALQQEYLFDKDMTAPAGPPPGP